MTASQAEGGGARVATRQQQRGLATRAAAVREGTAVGRVGGDAAATPRAQLGAAAAPRTRSRAGSLTKPPLVKTRGQPNRVTATPPPPTPPHVADSLAPNSSSPGRTRSAQSATRASAQQQQATPTAGQDMEMHNTRFAQQRRPASTTPSATATAAVATPVSSQAPAADKVDAPVSASTRAAEKANNNSNKSYPIPANAPAGYRPASAKPPMTRVPTFPLVEAYVPDSDPQERRHPRQLLPDDLGFPTAVMQGKIKRDDLDDKLLMATCAVLHAFENRALCPKEIAEVMLERDWLKNAGTTPFAHVSTCIRSHVARAAAASPPYPPLLVPFELVGALTVEEVRAVGLHAEQRPAVKRGTLWYLNPRVLGQGVGADDPFVRCRREAGLAPSDRDGLYVRGMVKLQHAPPTLPPALSLSSTLFTNTNDAAMGSPDEGDFDEEGMGRGKRKRRASSAMMAAMGREGAKGAVPSPLGSGSSTPVPIPSTVNAVTDDYAFASSIPTISHRRSQSLSGPSSAPVRSGIPKLKFRLSSLEEVDDSDGHTGEAAEWRRKNKKKVRRAGSEGVSRAGSVESNAVDDSFDEAVALAMGYSSASSSALLAQSLLAASTLDNSTTGIAPFAPQTTVSPDILSLGPTTTTSFPFSRPTSSRYPLSASAPNIFSHHFANAPSPPDVVMDDSSSSDHSRPPTSAGAGTTAIDAASPASDSPDDHEEDFHEAMLRGDDFDFEWGSESYSTTGTSSLEASTVAADLLAKAFEPREMEETPRGKSRDLAAADARTGDDDTTVDTPATTPRSLPQDLEDEVSKELNSTTKEEKKPEVETLPSPISRVGMSITLCGEMLPLEEDVDVASIKIEDYSKSEEPVITTTDLEALDASGDRDEERRHLDPVQIPAPPPSPLSLELTPTLALSNAFAATDYDFVGRDEAEGIENLDSPAYSHAYDVDVLADDEDGDDDGEIDHDDLLHVKLEDEEAEMAVSSAPSSRAGSAIPSAFDARLLTSVRASSTTSSSSDSDSFDPMNFVSPSTLATGLPVPQPAPSPPETNDWTTSLDMLDDLDLDGASADLMGPETIALEELDLAWAGDDDEGLSTEPLPRSSGKNKTGLSLKVPHAGSTAFLTGSTHRFTSPMPSPRRTPSSRLPSFTDLSKDARSPIPGSPTLASAAIPGKVFGASEFSSSSSVMMEPVIPLEPSVLAVIVQRGIVVFSVDVTDLATGKVMPLLRRLDTDYVNATVLLQAALSSPLERASALATLLVKTDTFRVPSSIADPGVEGTWIPLAAAEDVVSSYPKQLGHLAAFFGPDLAAHFPEPVPTMRSSSKNALAQKRHDPNGAVLGSPSFDGAELLRRCGPPSAPRELPSFVHNDVEDDIEAMVTVSNDGGEQLEVFVDVVDVVDAPEDGEEQDEDRASSAGSPPPTRPRRETRARRGGSSVKSKSLEQSPPRRSSRRHSTTAR